MNNIWTKRAATYELPVSLNEDRELEFGEVKGRDVPKLIRYWGRHLLQGDLTPAEHRAISAVIVFQIENQDAATI